MRTTIGRYDVREPIIPVAPHRESGTGVKIVVVLPVFALSLGGLIFWLSTKDRIKFGGGGVDRGRGHHDYVQFSMLESVSVCLIPVFADGQCYDYPEIKTTYCFTRTS